MFLLTFGIVGAMASSVDGMNFTIGYLAGDILMDDMQGSAISLAIESFQEKGWLQEHDFK